MIVLIYDLLILRKKTAKFWINLIKNMSYIMKEHIHMLNIFKDMDKLFSMKRKLKM